MSKLKVAVHCEFLCALMHGTPYVGGVLYGPAKKYFTSGTHMSYMNACLIYYLGHELFAD